MNASDDIDELFLENNGIGYAVNRLSILNEAITDNTWLEDRKIEHFWYENQKDVLYHGHILELKKPKNKPKSVIVTYWAEGETEDDSLDFKVPLTQVLIDYLLGDLVIW